MKHPKEQNGLVLFPQKVVKFGEVLIFLLELAFYLKAN